MRRVLLIFWNKRPRVMDEMDFWALTQEMKPGESPELRGLVLVLSWFRLR